MAHQRIAIEYEKGNVDKEALDSAAARVSELLPLLKAKFDGKAIASLQLAIHDLNRLVGEYNIKLVAVDNGLAVARFKQGDTIQTLDKGARDSAGKIVDFSPDGAVAKFQKGNGTIGEAHTTYIKHF